LKLSTYAIGIPAAAVAAVIAVANRQGVLFSLDPFSQTAPALAFQVPLFILLFVAVGFGILFGWLAGAVTRRRK
jgi:ribose/xylose/arabinose/galactoside ABC-type transport system permease subunit